MNTLKAHLSLIIPLVGLLFSLQCIMLMQRVALNQEKFIINKYAIGITSKTKLDIKNIKDKVKEAKELILLDTKEPLERLTKDIKDKSIINVKYLPYFYNLSLEYFPDSERLSIIQSVLKQLPNVLAVNTFSKRHLENYTFLSFIKFSLIGFSLLLLTISFLLMIKQVEIWRYAKKDIMEIMDMHGAGSWTKNGDLFKLALLDSIIATILISVFSIYLSNSSIFIGLLESIRIPLDDIFQIGFDFIKLFIFSTAVSVFSVIFVIISKAKV